MMRAVLILALLAGCASSRAGERAAYTAIGADSATTAWGLTQREGLREAGIAGNLGDDALAGVLLIDLSLSLGIRAALRRWPEWEGWPAVLWAIATVKGSAAAHNLAVLF